MSKRTHFEAHSETGNSGCSATKMATPLGSGILLSGSAEPILFTCVRSLEEMDKRCLQLQNKKLWEVHTERQAVISELRDRIEQLENRQAKDDALLCVINRYWNQLDEDCLIMLQRFDSDIEEEEISTSTESFLKQLASWDKEEVPEKLQERVHFSKRIIARLLSAYERLVARQSRLRQMNQPSTTRASSDQVQLSDDASSDPTIDSTTVSPARNLSSSDSGNQNAFCEEIAQLNKENQRLQSLCTNLHAKHRQSSLQLRELQDLAQSRLESAAEWQAKYEDSDYKLYQALSQVTRLDHRLYDAQQFNKQLEVNLAALKGTDGGVAANADDSAGSSTFGLTVNRTKYNDLIGELEEVRELLNNRTSELERLQVKWAEKVGENEVLLMKCQEISEEQILNSPQYQSIKSQFNILYNEALQLRSYLDEARSTLQTIRHSHLKHIEEMEINESAIQNQMRSEMLHMEGQYSQLRRAHETMELDFKQAMAHTEQSGPINSEMRSLISTLQTQNKQLKAEVSRYRRKCREVSQDLNLAKNDLKATEEELTQVRLSLSEASARAASSTVSKHPVDNEGASEPVLTPVDLPTITKMDDPEHEDSTQTVICPTCHGSSTSQPKSMDKQTSEGADVTTTPPTSDEVIRDLKEKLERSQEAQKEMSVLLNMYKVIPKDQRDKAALLQSEAKLRSEISDLKAEVERVHGTLHESRQSNRSLQQQLLTMKQQFQPKLPRDSPFIKVSPVDFTPPFPGTPVPPHGSASSASPANSIHKQPSPEDKSTNSSSVPQQQQQQQQPPTPTTVSELQLELQLYRRRKQSLELQLELHQNRLLAAQQQEEVLLKEMEVTGQAFEDVQEQNVRLVGNLREKDDANLKLMTERLKAAQLARLLKDDKRLLEEQIRMMHTKIEALNRSVCKQEDKERLLLTNLDTLEKETSARLQAQEAFKRKAYESQQAVEDLRVTVQKYQSQLKESQISVQEKASAFERISFRHQRLQEELVSIRRKYERLRKIEQSHNADEVLLAEIQDYKEQLTCPTCKTNRKDAILTKCFHVFCLHCLKIRYETRNRKCPKCNATFGANDYHRIYLS